MNITFDIEDNVELTQRIRSGTGRLEDNGGRELEQKTGGGNFGEGGGDVEGEGLEEREAEGNKMARSFMRQAIWHTGLSSNFSCTKYFKTLIIR